MTRTLRHLLIATAVLFAQQAAQLHAFSHLGRDIAVAQRGEKGAPPLSHLAEQCVAYHAVDSALPATALEVNSPRIALPAVPPVILPLPFPPRIAFDSRAPPVSPSSVA